MVSVIARVPLPEWRTRIDSLRIAVRAEFGKRAQSLRSHYRDLAAQSVPGVLDATRAVERLSVDTARRRNSPEAVVARALRGTMLSERDLEAELLALLAIEIGWPAAVGWSSDRSESFVLRLGREHERWTAGNEESSPVRGRVVLSDGAGELLMPCGSRALPSTVSTTGANAEAWLWVAAFPPPDIARRSLEQIERTLTSRWNATLRLEPQVAIASFANSAPA